MTERSDQSDDLPRWTYWWLVVLGAIFLAVSVLADSGAVDESGTGWFGGNRDAYREIGTGGVAAVVIGVVFFWIENRREDRRFSQQLEREATLARKLRDDANRETDVRHASNMIMDELTDSYDRASLPSQNLNRPTDIKPLAKALHRTKLVVDRCEDRQLSELFKRFDTASRRMSEGFARYSSLVKAKQSSVMSSDRPPREKVTQARLELVARRSAADNLLKALTQRADELVRDPQRF